MKTLLHHVIILVIILSMTTQLQAQNTSTNNDNTSTNSLNTQIKRLNAYIYPNPCVSEFNVIIEDQNPGEFLIKLMDNNYATITSNHYTSKNKGTVSFDFDISVLPTGTYYVKVAGKDGESTLKFMKQ